MSALLDGLAFPELIDIEAELCRRSLSEYVRRAWHLVEPGVPYQHNWHIDLISEYLTAVSMGQVQNLIINIPPRFMKSLMVNVFWPTWEWTWKPHTRWLCASYAEALATRDAQKSRRILQHPWYRARFGDAFELTMNQAAKYENDRSGYRISVGVGGSSTGEGGDRLVVDDPLKAQDAYSDAMRDGANDWWDFTWSTRANDPKTVARIVIMQRLHINDLTGHLLEQARIPGAMQYEHLCLPMRYEPKRFFSSIGKSDPRTEDNQLLWPERFDDGDTTALEFSLGEMGTAGQLQQRPSPMKGGIFQREWWEGKNRYDASDEQYQSDALARWLTFDCAFKDGEQNDYTAMNVWELRPDYKLALRQVQKWKLQFPQLLSTIVEESTRWLGWDRKLRGIIIEDKASGTSAFQTIKQSARAEIAEILIPFIPTGSKEYRWRQASLWCERDCILLPEPSSSVPWLFEFEEEQLYKLPSVMHDDEGDAFSMGILFLENLIAEGFRARYRLNEVQYGR